jgi:hypothetical protein
LGTVRVREQSLEPSRLHPVAFIQYWLINFDGACPANFQAFPTSPGHNHCVQLSNTSGAVSTTPVPVTNLGQVTLTGTASAGADSIIVTVGGTAFIRNGDNSVNASSGWKISEFNILGDGGDSNGVGGTASFNNTAATPRPTASRPGSRPR